MRGVSRCDACGERLAPLSLVPIVSHAAARGRARCCGARVSRLAPLAELALGLLFTLAYAQLGLSAAFAFVCAALASLLALVLYDLAHQILPPPFLAVFVAASALAGLMQAPDVAAFGWSLAIAFAIAGSLALIHLFSRGRAMGLSDAPLAFGLALLSGPAAFSGFIYSFWIGAVIGIAVLLGRPRGSRMGVEVPFAPFLAAGFLLAYFTQWNLLVFITALLPQQVRQTRDSFLSFANAPGIKPGSAGLP